MDPDEGIINECYRQRQVSNLLQMAKVLASDDCLCVHMEQILGNPEMVHSLPEPCGECPVCRNDKVFFQINKEGTKSVSLDLFIFGNYGIQGQPILNNVLNAIKSYPNVQKLIISVSRSRQQRQRKCCSFWLRMVFSSYILMLSVILMIQYDPYWNEMCSLVDFKY